MASVDSGSAACPRCGTSASGNFCSACGANLLGGRTSGFDDLPLIGEPIGLARTFWHITRAPVAEPVRLAALAGEKGPYRFLIAGVGMFVGFFLGMEALAKAWGVAGFTPEQDQFLSIAQYAILIHLAVAAVVVYAATALFAGRKVSAGAHARLWALLGGYYLTAETLLLITVVTTYMVIFFVLPGIAPEVLKIMSLLLAPAVVGVLLIMLVNLIFAHARQWAKPLWLSGLIFALALIATPTIAQPLQFALGSAVGGIARKIGMQSLFGVPL